MLIKPDLKDEEIIACLQDAYGLDIATVSFLPLGADFNTAVYRVTTTDGADHFLKLRSGKFLEASVSVPKYLADLGIGNFQGCCRIIRFRRANKIFISPFRIIKKIAA